MKRLTSFHRIVQRSLILGAVLVLSAGSMFSSTDPRFEPAPLAEYEGLMPASLRWSASIGSGSGFGFIPYVQGQDVYTASASGQEIGRASCRERGQRGGGAAAVGGERNGEEEDEGREPGREAQGSGK